MESGTSASALPLFLRASSETWRTCFNSNIDNIT